MRNVNLYCIPYDDDSRGFAVRGEEETLEELRCRLRSEDTHTKKKSPIDEVTLYPVSEEQIKTETKKQKDKHKGTKRKMLKTSPKIPVGLKCLSDESICLEHPADAWDEFGKLLNSCGEKNRAAVIKLVVAILSGYTVRKFAKCMNVPESLEKYNRGPVVTVSKADYAGDFIESVTRCFHVPLIGKSELLKVKSPPVLPAQSGYETILDEAYIKVKGVGAEEKLPAQYRDSCVMVYAKNYKGKELVQLETTNPWASIILYDKTAKNATMPFAHLEGKQFSDYTLDWDEQIIKHLVVAFLESLQGVKKPFLSGLAERAEAAILSCRKNGILKDNALSSIPYLKLQLATIDLFLITCLHYGVIEEDMLGEALQDWQSAVLEIPKVKAKKEESSLSPRLALEAVVKTLFTQKKASVLWVEKAAGKEKTIFHREDDAGVAYQAYLTTHAPKNKAQKAFVALLIPVWSPLLADALAEDEDFLKTLHKKPPHYLDASKTKRLPQDFQDNNSAVDCLILHVDKLDFLTEEEAACLRAIMPSAIAQ